MPANGQSNQNQQNTGSQPQSQDFETLVRRVSDRVWELWREDLRRNRERRADPSRR